MEYLKKYGYSPVEEEVSARIQKVASGLDGLSSPEVLKKCFSLMDLTTLKPVIRKVVPDGPHDVMLILDASTGQNAFAQAKEFARATDITSLTVTKLDGTAKGGVVVGVSDQFHIPVKFIGVGEGIDDLKVFDKQEFVEQLFAPEDLK